MKNKKKIKKVKRLKKNFFFYKKLVSLSNNYENIKI